MSRSIIAEIDCNPRPFPLPTFKYESLPVSVCDRRCEEFEIVPLCNRRRISSAVLSFDKLAAI